MRIAVLRDDYSKRAGLWTAAAGVLMVAGYYYFSIHRRQRKGRHKPRTASFTSVGMALGSFPLDSNIPAATINAACYFGANQCPSVGDIATGVVEPLLKYERFAQVLDKETHCFRPSINAYKASDLVRELVVEGDEQSTNRTIFAHLQDVLDQGRNDLPWWEILLIKNTGNGSSACVIRVHHTIGDGLALIGVFQNILTTQDGSPWKLLTDTMRPPKTSKKNVFALAWSLIAATFHVLTLSTTKYDDDTAFSKHNHATMVHTGKRDFLIFPEIPLSFIKAIKSAANCTVNDVLMTAVSQAIYEYCQLQNDPVLAEKGVKIQCRALLPVGFPRSAEELADPTTALKNKWCMASCGMAIGQDNVVDRLRAIHTNTTEMKEKPRAFMQLKVQNSLASKLPVNLARQTCMDVFSRHSLVLTNVPGPTPEKVRLAGMTVEKVHLFFENILSQVSLISYADIVCGNIIYDHQALPSLDQFGFSYARALMDLAEAFKVEVPKEMLELRKAVK